MWMFDLYMTKSGDTKPLYEWLRKSFGVKYIGRVLSFIVIIYKFERLIITAMHRWYSILKEKISYEALMLYMLVYRFFNTHESYQVYMKFMWFDDNYVNGNRLKRVL
jgi:hypothetical protein